ncbi:hypothetical protein DID78_00860 [Candidatus Marinamargulisbacteria bacterium SCGC AG-343-D04]|nr:hypothetical protein DID78_00860 [Candidatus Marinamargulisbacteria bacterium SCGC AG-343-D04]
MRIIRNSLVLFLCIFCFSLFSCDVSDEREDLALPDLVSEISVVSDIITVTMQNTGTVDVDSSTEGHTYIYVNDLSNPRYTYSWTELSDISFLEVGLSSTIERATVDVLGLGTSYTLKSCVDATEKVVESDESNNCDVYSSGCLGDDSVYQAIDPTANAFTDAVLSLDKFTEFNSVVSALGTPILIDFESETLGDFSTLTVNSSVTFNLLNTGDALSFEQPGIANDSDATKGFNTSSGGSQHLQVFPLENSEGGLKIEFKNPVKALGFYLMGREETKRDVYLEITFSDNSVIQLLTDTGEISEGGIQFIGLITDSVTCGITQIELREMYSETDGSDKRDIFGIDDVYYLEI